jgi:hypothetical protein
MSYQPLQPVGALLSRTFAFYREHLRLAVALTFPVVAVVDVILAAGLGEFTAGVHQKASTADFWVELAADLFVTVPIVTAMLAQVVVGERRDGTVPPARRAAEDGLELFVPALIPVVIYAIGVAIGGSFLVIPGVYLYFSWYFVVQAVVVDGARGFGAVMTSAALVRGHWWHTAGVVVCLEVLIGIPALIVSTGFMAIASLVDSEAITVLGSVLVDTAALPFVVIGATLYYLELRGRAQLPAPR